MSLNNRTSYNNPIWFSDRLFVCSSLHFIAITWIHSTKYEEWSYNLKKVAKHQKYDIPSPWRILQAISKEEKTNNTISTNLLVVKSHQNLVVFVFGWRGTLKECLRVFIFWIGQTKRVITKVKSYIYHLKISTVLEARPIGCLHILQKCEYISTLTSYRWTV